MLYYGTTNGGCARLFDKYILKIPWADLWMTHWYQTLNFKYLIEIYFRGYIITCLENKNSTIVHRIL